MKTQPLREDKHCLNCGTEVPERYCTHCGQENAVPHESFGHLVKHFVGDVLHYDSQFLKTISHLLFRPGRLTKEYMAGRRVAFVNPIKLYIFISFVFFLTWAMLSHDSHEKREKHSAQKEAAAKDQLPSITGILGAVKDSLKNNKDLARAVDSLAHRYRYDSANRHDAAAPVAAGSHDTATAKDSSEDQLEPGLAENELDPRKKYADVEAYDSAQAALPKDQRDGWFKRVAIRKLINMDFSDNFQEGLSEALKHHFPKMMFVLLPLFALWLKLIYNWKRWYYTDHAIFALHVHCFAYTVLLLAYILEKITGWENFIGWSTLLIFTYLVLALRNTYQQSFRRSFAKSLLLVFGYSISFAFVGAFFVLIIFAVIL
ncbi:DUF3667 domain-containing protein [Chitinophaga sp. GbtcB8]|uniref:DUF3667 domain-containing protein n=1 Tax=Chitinophaga sp. GbtcB8 TaxID=2824753 RepID=UPI001C305576|nr:DUF3667 domain-containing protein [Chitinophaga sp. GbtcB8]